jgi:hypothetical protein
MKKPSHLKLKENNTVKRIRAIPKRFEERKNRYAELKELREILKKKKSDNVEAVIN